MSSPFESFLATPEAIDGFGSVAFAQAMLDFEAALARASSEVALIPRGASEAIAAQCNVELHDVDAIVAASGNAGSLAIPLVKSLTESVAKVSPEAARYVHWGATSQDVIDTAMVLCTRRLLVAIDFELSSIRSTLARLAGVHQNTPVLARTLMQAAQVTSFGLKCAQWLAPIARSQWALRELAPHALCLQLGGAVGTRATLGERGAEVARKMATELKLANPATAWHTGRDRWLRLGSELAILSGSLGKVARDLSLMGQSEIAEVAEGAASGRGGSSAMPHKRNPVGAMIVLAAALRAPHRMAALLSAMPQEHERGLGNWQAELAEWAGLCTSVLSACTAMANTLNSLQCFPERMLRNVAEQRGMVFAEAAAVVIARALGKSQSHALVETAAARAHAEGGQLQSALIDALDADPKRFAAVDRAALDSAFSMAEAARFAGTHVDAVLQELNTEYGLKNSHAF